MRVTWWGHATVAIEDQGRTLLTDPVLRNRLAHLYRRSGPTPKPTTTPDAALISHLHSDHCDIASLRQLPRSTRIVAPRGAAGFLLRRLGDRDITELDEGDETSVGPIRVRAVPANHHGGRHPISRVRAAAIGYLVSGTRTAWFAGDTGLHDGMSTFGDVDLALVPVWGWGWSIGDGHLDPGTAAEAVRRVAPVHAVPIHWGTLWPVGCARIRPDRFSRPGHEFTRFASRVAPHTTSRVLAPGASLSLTASRSAP